MNDGLPLWLTAQLCIILYVVAISIPSFFTYVSHKRYKTMIEGAIRRYLAQRRRQDERIRCQQQEKRKMYNKNMIMKSVQYQHETSSSSTSSSSSSSSSEESEEEMIAEKNTSQVLEHYKNRMDNIIDLFDGQASMTTTSAATTIMIQAPRRPGRVLHI